MFSGILIFLGVIFTIFISINYFNTVGEATNLTAEQQRSHLTLLNDQIEEQLASIEGQSVVLGRQNNLNDVVRGNASYYQMGLLTTEITNVVVTNYLIDSIELYIDSPLPPAREDTPVKFGSLSDIEDSDLMNNLGDDNVKWLGIRQFELFDESRNVITLARKLRNFRGEVHALLLVNINPTELNNWLASFQNQSDLLILNDQNEILASTNESPLAEVYALLIELDTPNQPVHQIVDDNLIVANRLASPAWTTLSITSYDYLTNTSREMALGMTLVSIIMISLALVGSMFVITQFTAPFNQLINLMKDYKLNRTVQEIPDDYENEFGEIFDVYKNLIERNEYLLNEVITHHNQQKIAELKALQANINPHFLYNTLDQLNWRAIENDDDEMSHMIELLGEMLRIGLSKGESVIPIEREVAYVEKYLELQQIRLENRISYSLEVEENIKDSYIPKLTLQPFVENSIIHGFNNMDCGHITIKVLESADETITITIKDTGEGAETFEKSSNTDTGGYGIKNVRERLDTYYNYQAKIYLANAKDKGVIVKIVIPNITNVDGFQILTNRRGNKYVESNNS